jgi:predicted aldo/keto reductase-like oxidoreductase
MTSLHHYTPRSSRSGVRCCPSAVRGLGTALSFVRRLGWADYTRGGAAARAAVEMARRHGRPCLPALPSIALERRREPRSHYASGPGATIGSMQRMVLGRTGLEVYRLGFGGIPIQRVSEAEAVETVRHAIERGVDFIDTSRAYTTSERCIGMALKQAGVGDGRRAAGGRHVGADGRAESRGGRRVILASKSHAKTADAMRVELEMSLKELQRDYIDIYKCHFVANHTDYEKVVSAGGALEALQKARDENLIGHIGITSHNLEVLDRSLDDDLFDVIMVCFSFLEPQAREKIIPKALEKNVGVLAMKPFSGGVIEDARLALKYALAEPGVLVLAGVESPELVDNNWGVFQEEVPLTGGEKAEIAELQRTFDKVFCRRCDYCQPCTEDIPIQTVLGVRSMAKRMGKQLLQKGPFWPGIERARNCTDCGDCMTRCPYELPIPDLIRENLRWLDELED